MDQLTISVEAREAFALLGANGAGKTVTMKMLTTLLRPSAGNARVAGFDIVHHASQVRRVIGYVPQLVSADGALTGYENLLVFAKLYDIPGPPGRSGSSKPSRSWAWPRRKKRSLMKRKSLLGIVAAALWLLAAPAAAQSPAAPPQVPERSSLGTRVGAPRFPDTPCSPPFLWPLFTVILDHRGELAFSPAQVEHLERLCLDVTREAIRRQADLDVGLLDIAVLLRPDPADPAKPIDMPKVEAALRAMERVDVDLDITRLRAIEEGKAQLTADQRSKLARLMAGDDRPNPGRPPGSFWYCPSSGRYYPYATSCDQPWVRVPAWPQ